MVVFALGKNLLFKSVLGHCVIKLWWKYVMVCKRLTCNCDSTDYNIVCKTCPFFGHHFMFGIWAQIICVGIFRKNRCSHLYCLAGVIFSFLEEQNVFWKFSKNTLKQIFCKYLMNKISLIRYIISLKLIKIYCSLEYYQILTKK